MADYNLPFEDPTTTNRRLDTETFTGYDGQSVHRERILITGANSTASAELTSSDPSASAYGIVVRDPKLLNTLDVKQVSGANWSVSVSDIFASAGADVINPDGRLKVELPSGASGLTDTELRAAHLDVLQLSGSIDSVYATGAAASFFAELLNADNRVKTESVGTQTVTATDLDIRDLANATDSVSVYQVSGANWSVSVTNTVTVSDGGSSISVDDNGSTLSVDDGGSSLTIDGTVTVSSITATTAANIVDSTGVAYSGSNPVPISDAGGNISIDDGGNSITVDGTVLVSDITASVKASLIDSSGVQYSGSNPVPVTVAGATSTVVVIGPIASDVAANGDAPLKMGGIGRTANPTAVAGGDMVSATFDDLGRQLVRPVQVRDLIATAYVSLTTGTETTLLAASAGVFHDCISIMCANQSNVAALVDIRSVTAGNVVASIVVPAGSTAGVTFAVPYPQDATGNNWTADLEDITGTTVDITALFTKEV